MQEFDQIIIGQGIAGSALAWQLHWLGQRVAIIDRNEDITASRIAAGLISPVSGKRNAVSWRFDELFANSQSFYRRIENETNETTVCYQPMLKVVEADSQWTDNESVQGYLGERSVLPLPMNDQLKAIELSPAGRLDVPKFLAVTRRFFEADDAYFVGELDPNSDIRIESERVQVDRFGVEAKKLIFCQGIRGVANPWFEEIRFEPTKGEILTLDIPGLDDQRTIHGVGWLARLANGHYLAGATYERLGSADLKESIASVAPTGSGRNEILSDVQQFGLANYSVLDHKAAVRPSIQGRLPKVGMSSSHPRIGFFNGLGSKGSLRAPFVAEQFAKHIVRGDSIEPEISILSTQPSACGRRLTSLAHDEVTNVLAGGEIAIDATAGNGFDTLFLSKTVGEQGHVYAIDIQQEAIDRTARRLANESVQNATLTRGSHEQMLDILPSECIGRVGAIMFNLGYLPRGDVQLVTKTQSTLAAIGQGVELLRDGGVMTILAYTGHPGGLDEAKAVEELLGALPGIQCRTVQRTEMDNAPRLYVLRKLE